VARVMACHPAIRAFGIDFRASRDAPYSAEQLGDLFSAAAAQAPSLVILEDIDKVGAGDPEAMRHAINGLLSCMDGLTTEDGVIVVATANNPTPLSNALLKRPGRFDRVALFPVPTAELRQRYLMDLSGGNFEETEAAEASLELDRFSFAQIRESYILAGQFAFDRGDELTAKDLAKAARQIRREGKRLNGNGQNGAVGFSIVEDLPSIP
jgi:ATP-dependent 26S proteasome regulatory subunit